MDGGWATHFFDNKIERDLRPRTDIVDLQVLRFIEAVFRRERAEQRVRAFVEGCWARRMRGVQGGGAVFGGVEVV